MTDKKEKASPKETNFFSNFRNGKGVNWAEVGENNDENHQYEHEEERGNQTEENGDMEVMQSRGSREI